MHLLKVIKHMDEFYGIKTIFPKSIVFNSQRELGVVAEKEAENRKGRNSKRPLAT